jgi:hypothetical protein
MQLHSYVSVISIALLLTACESGKDASKSNFAKAIDAKFAERCISVDPGNLFFNGKTYPLSAPMKTAGNHGFENTTEAQAKTANEQKFSQMDALVKSGMLIEKDAPVKPMFGNEMVPGRVYTLTDAGKKALQRADSSALCVGHYKVDEVVDFTVPGSAMGATISSVNYSYSPTDVASWATDDAVKAAFPNLASKLAPGQKGRATLVLKNNGWSAGMSAF